MASRDLVVHLIGDDASLQRAYKRSAAETDRFDRKMSQTFRGVAAGSGVFNSLGRQIAFASSSFLGAAGLTAVLTKSVNAASNLAEQTNKVNVIFGKSASIITDWSRTTANGIGIANDQALEAAGTFGNLFTTVGLAPQKNAELSKSLVQLAADLASFNNASPEDTLLALRSGLVGEAEPLRRYGILLTEARVQQEALRESGKKNATQLTQQEKLLARYSLIVKDSTTAQGDFARTSDGQANAQRRLTAEIRDSEAAIGKGLLPAINDVTKALADWLGKPSNQKKIQDDTQKTVGFFGSLLHQVHMVGSEFKTWADRINDVAAKSRALNAQLEKTLGLAKQTGDFGAGVRPSGGGGDFTSPTVRPFRESGGPATVPTVFRRPRMSLQGQMNLLETMLAKALTTVSAADDRAILVLQKKLTGRLLANTKDWKVRRQLYQDLARIQDQIGAIDDKAASDRQDAIDKEKAARQKQLDAEKKKRDALAEHNRRLREAWQAQLEKIREATAAVRSEFGQLPFEASPTGILGVTGQSAKSFVGAYVNQTRAFVRFYNDLSRLRRMGAPRGLVDQLRGLGPDAAGLIHSLGRHPGQLNRLIRAFGEREKVVQQIAHADIHARNVVVHVAGSRVGMTSASQRRGRQAGVPTSIGAWASGGHS